MNKTINVPSNCISATLFGKFQLTNNCTGQILDSKIISSEKITKLLSYILVHHSNAIPIHELTDILWADEETSNPVGALKNLVYRMRTLLKKHLGDYEFIGTSRGSYYWNKEIPLLLDLEQYDMCLSQARDTASNADKISLLEQAVAYYTGRFMPSISGEHWVISLATYYHTTYLDAIHELADLYTKESRYTNVVSVCNLGLVQDPLDETLHYDLVRALMNLNDNSQALNHYNRAVTQLQQALGVNAPSMLKSLHAELLSMNSQTSSNLEDVQDSLGETNPNGAFHCSYGVFCELYRMEARRIRRLGTCEYIVLYTISPGQNKLAAEETQFLLMKKATNRFEQILQACLRIGDVMTRYSEFQIACLLPTCTYEAALGVSDRQIATFMKEFSHNRIDIKYSINEIGTPSTSFP